MLLTRITQAEEEEMNNVICYPSIYVGNDNKAMTRMHKSHQMRSVQGLRNPFYLVPDKPRTTRYKNST